MDIKSALEIAQEKVEKLGDLTPEERLKWKYSPVGEQLGAKYLKENVNLVTELSQYQDNVRKYVVDGAAGVLIENIIIPRNDVVKNNNRKAMDGLKLIKNDKVKVENIYSKIRYLFNHYAKEGEGQRNQAYQNLKSDFQTKVQQAVQQQLGSASGMKIDVESIPQFQQEWRKVLAELDSQYTTMLTEYKRELMSIG